MVNGSLVSELIPSVGIYLRLIRFLIVLVIGIVLTRAVVLPLTRRILNKRSAGSETKHSILNLASIIGYFLSFTIALQAGNFGNLVTIIGAFAAALTVAIGFGMRDQVSNLVAGVLIYIYKPLIVGDYIKSQTAEGVVESINLLSTTLTGSSSQRIVVPNGQLTTEELKNYSLDSRTKASVKLSLPLNHIEDGTEILEEIANERPDVLESPPPDIFYSEDDGDVCGELHFWLSASESSTQIKSEILEEYTQRAIEFGLSKPRSGR